MRAIQLIFINLLFLTLGFSQNEHNENSIINREFRAQAGFSFVTQKESRFTANKHLDLAPIYTFGHIKSRRESISELWVSFSSNKPVRGSSLNLKFVRPLVNYSYTRKVNNSVWIGGFLESNTLLNFPATKSYFFTNNPIAYTIAQSIGPKIKFASQLNDLDAQPLNLYGSIESALLSYVVRPGFGHPYPEKFLEDEVFTPTRKGMAGPLMRSGKVVLPGKYSTLKIKLGISYHLSDHIRIGMEYKMDSFGSRLDHPANFTSHDIQFFLSYNY